MPASCARRRRTGSRSSRTVCASSVSRCESTDDSLIVHGPVRLRAAHLDAAGDHRFAMAWAIAAALVPPGGGETVIDGADAAAVSYPDVLQRPGERSWPPDLTPVEAQQQMRSVAGLDDFQPADGDGDREHVRPVHVGLGAGGMRREASSQVHPPARIDDDRRGATALDPSRRVAGRAHERHSRVGLAVRGAAATRLWWR